LRLRGIAVVLCLLVCAGAAGARGGKPITVVFLAPAGSSVATEVLDGVEAAASELGGIPRLKERAIRIVPVDLGKPAKTIEKEIAKAKPVAIVAAPGPAETDLVARLARRKKSTPCLVATPWAPPFRADPKDVVFHLAGNTVDQAIVAAGYGKIPLKATKVAALHDGSFPSRDLAAAFLRNRYEGVGSGEAHETPRDDAALGALLKKLAGENVDLVWVATGREDAVRIARANGEGTPRLLFSDGLLGEDLAKVAREDARYLSGTNLYLEGGAPARYRIGREGKPPRTLGERGHMAISVLVDALEKTGTKTRGLIPALRQVGYEALQGTQVFTEWGQARLFRWYLWERTADGLARIKPTYLPDKNGGVLLRQGRSIRYRARPDTMLVHLTWRDDEKRTIEQDLRKLGLYTTGYEAALDEMVKDEILFRMMQRLNRLFWRNADGTPIPGVSWRISFTTELPSTAKKRWIMPIAGDHPRAGGMAADPNAFVFSTFIVRTIYLNLALDPVLGREDQDYFTNRYAWATTAAQNIRCDEIRCLLEGFAGSMALTGAHELGHLAGLGHDVSSPRSIMNVQEGGGLEPDWAEWIPAHARTLTSRLRRHEAKEGDRR
jgi:ABC-type branched-subunit amino acid transport system substrate-binding protein